ncbi:MAG: flagellar biosynthesis protein FlhF [Treponema sp.]|jgi:flagellar biosynthesis protein FlhF|nr:flagellar biosynthesis protein FlhF [Treponema sp.]
MEQFIEQAPTYDECIRKVRSKYGEWAKINVILRKNIRIGTGPFNWFSRDGVELTGTVSRGFGNAGGYPPQTPQRPLDFEEEKQRQAAEKAKLLALAGKPDAALQALAQDVKFIREQLEAVPAAVSGEHPALGRLEEVLALNDFSPAFIRKLLDRARKELSLETLEDYNLIQDRVVEWIGENIVLDDRALAKPWDPQRSPRIMVLVGPTGVGKTTTIAKLAALFSLGASPEMKPLSVRIITIDAFRIGAKQQIEKYADILGIPVSAVENQGDLRRVLALYKEDVDLILVDTTGRSPQDAVELGKMKIFLDICGSQAEVYLALAAATKTSDIRDILRQFEPFKYRSVIITKLDETKRAGNVISALSEGGKSAAFITSHQEVPHGLQTATAVSFLINLEEFRIDRDKIEKRFPHDDSKIIQWRE